MSIIRISLLIGALLHGAYFSSAQDLPDTIVSRYRQFLFRTTEFSPQLVEKWHGTLNQAGQWPDIDYNDNQPAGWKVSNHLVRIRALALAYGNAHSSWYGNAQLKETINRALDHWTQKRYQSSNWWHNEIGVPRCMRDIIILYRSELTPERWKQALEVMAQLRVHENYVGGNLIWCADLGLHYGALTRDTQLVRRCRNLILKEITISTGEGIQPDHSFHQHGKRLQMYQYGKAFVGESLRIAWQLRQTPLTFPAEKVDILSDFVIEGWQWMARGVHTVPGTQDRSASRKGELRSADLRALIPFMIELEPHKERALAQMQNIQNGNGALSGFRYFPRSDFAAWHRPAFSFFLKTISARTYATESINFENLKGKLLHSGDAYLIHNGEEYYNLLPLWDWTALPGVTMFRDAHVAERKHRVGSVSDSVDGLSVMDYGLKDATNNVAVSAQKFWACYNNTVVCLIADLQTTGNTGPVYTALDQCRWQSDVTVNKPRNVIKPGSHRLTDVRWLHHHGFAYIPLQPATVSLQLKEDSANWTVINASETPEVIKDRLFLPVLMHDTAHRSTGYVLAYAETARKAAKLASKPAWKIIQNDKAAQAVMFNDGTLMAAFYSPGSIIAGKKESLQVSDPCLVLIKNGRIYASDPAQKGVTVTITWNNETHEVALPANGYTVRVGESYAVVN